MKKLLKFAFILGIIFLILFIITGGTIIRDFSKLKERIVSAPVIVLMENEGQIIAGFVDSNGIEIFRKDKIVSIDLLYKMRKLDEIKGDNYKLFIIDIVKLEELEEVKVNNKIVSTKQLKDFFISDKHISSITYEDIEIEMNFKDKQDANFKSALFAYLYEKEIKITKSPLFFFRNYKEGRITVYPETIFFRFTKIIPLKWIDEKLNKLKATVQEKISESVKEAIG